MYFLVFLGSDFIGLGSKVLLLPLYSGNNFPGIAFAMHF